MSTLTYMTTQDGGRMYHTIDVSDVLYFRADTKYIMLHTAGKEILYTGTLKKIKEDNPHLMMINRNILVDPSKIYLYRPKHKGLENSCVKVRGCDDWLPVSRRERPAVRRYIKGLGS